MANPTIAGQELHYPDLRLEVFIESGDVFIRQLNGDEHDQDIKWKHVAQLCFAPEAVGMAVERFINGESDFEGEC